tara:strand:+ start:1181 stop:1375 length:195 start_codon:yes stop_codon:yes gene_type:complete
MKDEIRSINPAEEYELNFLRNRVDALQERSYLDATHHDLSNDAKKARKELKEFVIKLRKKGVNI